MSEWTTADVKAALAEKYKAPEFALFFEVANATGSAAKRAADAIAMSLWPSAGLEINGFEIKISRSDWLRELKKPEKAESIQKHCHRWWVVAGNKDIIKPEEVPSTWGLIERSGEKLRIVKQAVAGTPEPLSYGFLAAILRRAHTTDERALNERIQAEVDRVVRSREGAAIARLEQQLKNSKESEDRVRSALREFEEASGIKVTPWNAGSIGSALKLFMDSDRKSLAMLAQQMQEQSETLSEMGRALKQAIPLPIDIQ